MPENPFNNAIWERTIPMKARLEREGKLIKKNGIPYFQGYYRGERREFPIIERESSILGRVFLGTNSREAIYVGFESHALNDLLKEVKQRSRDHGVLEKYKIIPAVYSVVRESMQSDNNKVEQLLDNRDLWDDQIISLGEFLRAGFGACRHYALACGALLETCKYDLEFFKAGKQIRGQISIDRNKFVSYGHAWARYTSFDGTIVIMDPAQNFIGEMNKENIQKIKQGELWPYLRPEEINKFRLLL